MLLVLVSAQQAQAQSCHGSPAAGSAPAQFARLAKAPGFGNAHPAPLPVVASNKGKRVALRAPDAEEPYMTAYVVEPAQPTNNTLLVFHEWWGLNAHICNEADRLAALLPNLRIVAVDLYAGQVATTPDAASELMQNLSDDDTRSRLNLLLRTVTRWDAQQPAGRVATLGWCMGGTWSLQTALMAGPSAAACVMYYGMPEKDAARLQQLACPVLGIFAQQDDWITPDVVQGFASSMQLAGRSLELHSYEAAHAFANPSNPRHDAALAADAQAKAVAFVARAFE